MSREVRSGWKVVRLGDVARESRARNADLTIPPDRLVGVFKDQGMQPMRERVRGASIERCKIVEPGAFAYNPMRINIGSIARSDSTERLLVSPDYVVFEPDEAKIDGAFLDLLRKSEPWGAFVGHAGDGGVRIRIYFDHLAEFRFALPPLHEQRRIAEILSSVDEAIAATRAVIEQTRKVKQAVLERLLTKGIGHVSFKQTEIGEIPEGWEVTILGEVVNNPDGLQTGPFGSQLKAEEYVQDGIPVVMPRDLIAGVISTRQISRVAPNKVSQLQTHVLRAGDIVFARRGDIGRFALVSTHDEGFLCGTGCLRARLNFKKVIPQFASAFIESEFAKEWMNNNAVGQTMLNINTSIISRLPFSLPPLGEQAQIVEAVDSFGAALPRAENSLSQLYATKSALMSDLLTGRKRVTDALPLAAE